MIVFIMPEYVGDLGDCCRVLGSNGEILYKKKIQSVIRDIYKENYIDFECVKRRTSDLLNQKNLNPLFIRTGEIMIPVKIRKQIVTKDSIHGYVNVFEISKVMDKQIILKGNHIVPFYDSRRVISRRIKMARILEEGFSKGMNFFQNKNFYEAGLANLIDHFLKEINSIKMMMEGYLTPLNCY